MLAGKVQPVPDAASASAAPGKKSSQGRAAKTSEAVAIVAGVSHDTVRKVEQIIANATPEVVAKVRNGALSINAAAKTVAPPKPARLVEPPASNSIPARAATPNDTAAVAAGTDELAALREELAELKISFAETLADNESMGRTFDADDMLKTAMEEVKRMRAVADSAERTLMAKSGEFAEAIRSVKYWKNRAEKAEKMNKAVA